MCFETVISLSCAPDLKPMLWGSGSTPAQCDGNTVCLSPPWHLHHLHGCFCQCTSPGLAVRPPAHGRTLQEWPLWVRCCSALVLNAGLHKKFRWHNSEISTIGELGPRLESSKHILFKDQYVYLLLKRGIKHLCCFFANYLRFCLDKLFVFPLSCIWRDLFSVCHSLLLLSECSRIQLAAFHRSALCSLLVTLFAMTVLSTDLLLSRGAEAEDGAG